MIRIVWQYRIRDGCEAEFTRRYAAGGDWARLFRRDSAFHEVVLLRDVEEPRRFATIDVWEDLASYRAFRECFREEYERLDAACEALTESERCVGIFADSV